MDMLSLSRTQYDRVRVGDVKYMPWTNPRSSSIHLKGSMVKTGPPVMIPLPRLRSVKHKNQTKIFRWTNYIYLFCSYSNWLSSVECSPAAKGSATCFSCTKNKSAALLIRYRTIREPARYDPVIERYIIDNQQPWPSFSQKKGYPVRLQDLLLVKQSNVTGSWANIT